MNRCPVCLWNHGHDPMCPENPDGDDDEETDEETDEESDEETDEELVPEPVIDARSARAFNEAMCGGW